MLVVRSGCAALELGILYLKPKTGIPLVEAMKTALPDQVEGFELCRGLRSEFSGKSVLKGTLLESQADAGSTYMF